MQSYRCPYEQLVLGLTLAVIAVVTLIFAGPTLCALPLLLGVFVWFSYRMTRLQHQQLLSQGEPVGRERNPNLAALAGECMQRLQVGGVELFVVPSKQLNAYTFGLSNPKTVVLFSALFQTMDADEMRFVVGHELGHVALDHAWLNTLIGGMGGVPMPFEAAVVLTLAFRWWNRMCEYSADRAGLLACANPQKAVSALIKLFSGSVDSPAEMERALALIEQEDDSFANVLAETFSTHPMLVRRIRQVREYAATPEYRRLQAEVLRRAG